MVLKKFNKKGSILDIPYIVVMVLFLGIVVIIVGKLADSVSSNLNQHELLSNTSIALYTDYEKDFTTVWDAALMLIIVGLSIASIILAFQVRSHPVFFGVMIFVMAILALLGGMFSNVYDEFRDNSDLSGIADEMPMYDFVMSKLPLWTLAICVIISIATYARPGGDI